MKVHQLSALWEEDAKLLFRMMRLQKDLLRWLSHNGVPVLFCEKENISATHGELWQSVDGVGDRERLTMPTGSIFRKAQELAVPETLFSGIGKNRKTLLFMGVNVHQISFVHGDDGICLTPGTVLASSQDAVHLGYRVIFTEDICGDAVYINRKENRYMSLPEDGDLSIGESDSSDVYSCPCRLLLRGFLNGSELHNFREHAHLFAETARLAKVLSRYNGVELPSGFKLRPLAGQGTGAHLEQNENCGKSGSRPVDVPLPKTGTTEMVLSA